MSRGRSGERGGDARSPLGWLEYYHRLAPVTVPLYALLMALGVGAVVMLAAGANPLQAYGALMLGAVGNGDRLVRMLVRSTPYIVAGLAVALAYRNGLFNIGAEGQMLVGALTGVWVGTLPSLAGLPVMVYLPLVVLAGAVGGLVWGGIPGVLKARTGAHEVIVTIMLNAIALRLVDFVVTSRNPALLVDLAASTPRSRDVADAARLPALVPGSELSVALLVAVVLCVMVWFVLDRTTVGLEIRMSGLNPEAARYAGISVPRTTILVMAVSGALAGIGGVNVVSGSVGHLTPGLLRNIGFDSIAIALIARGNPLAVIPAALLWGALLSGAPLMQVQAGLSIDLVRVVQACVILFVAADAVVRSLFRVREGREPAAATGGAAGEEER